MKLTRTRALLVLNDEKRMDTSLAAVDARLAVRKEASK
jgi:hypothetical protein